MCRKPAECHQARVRPRQRRKLYILSPGPSGQSTGVEEEVEIAREPDLPARRDDGHCDARPQRHLRISDRGKEQISDNHHW